MRKIMLIIFLVAMLAGCQQDKSETAVTPTAADQEAAPAWEEPTPATPRMSPTPSPSSPAQPDRTSWASISEMVVRPENWQPIVRNSSFSLGGRQLAGSWEDADGLVEYYTLDWGTYPSIDGSTVCVPLAAECARQHLGMSDDDIPGFVCFSTTHYAYENIIGRMSVYPWVMSQNAALAERPVDLLLATQPSDDEIALANEKGVALVIKPVCRDAFVFITNKDNPVDSLTTKQIRDIYSGEITNWSQVGGEDMPIIAFQRDENSGSQTTMLKQVMQGQTMIKPEAAQVAGEMGELIDSVAEYRNGAGSIGYTFRFYLETLYRNENIKMLRVDGIAPDDAGIKSGVYPFSTCYYGIIRSGEEKKRGGFFLTWLLSDEGQRCVQQAGYCPLQ